MKCQRHLFSLGDSATYLNSARMSPLLKSAEEAGYAAMLKKRNPQEYTLEDFFDRVVALKESFASIINAPTKQIALTPATSYGMANAAANISPQSRNKIIVAGEQFPSNYYVWQRYCDVHRSRLHIVNPDISAPVRGRSWNENILSAIDDDTILVALSHVHWADGTRFDLQEIGAKCRRHGVKLVIDGTQSIGVLPFDVEELGVDVLIASGYKCLMGPYGLGYAYYSEEFNEGVPIENSWINRKNSDDFARLVDYESAYRDGAYRYNVGESSSFIHVAMAQAGLTQLIEWGAEEVQSYCEQIIEDAMTEVEDAGYWIEEKNLRAAHLFGIRPPSHVAMDRIKARLTEERMIVSYRGSALRISPSVYNTSEEMKCLSQILVDLAS